LNDAKESTTELAPASASGISRRQVMVGAAWAAPVVALAVATPLAAASEPIAAPNDGTYTSQFDSGVSLQVVKTLNPNRVNINPTGSSYISFYVQDNETGDLQPNGLYTAGVVSFVLSWGAGGPVTTPGAYHLTEIDLMGWARVGEAPADGPTGSVTYQYTGLLNGTQAILPRLRLNAPTGNALPASYVQSSLSATYLSQTGQFAVTP
jgi:hypothetical protein